MSRMQTLEKFILTEIAAQLNKENLNPDEDLLEQGIIDSLGILKLIVFLEEAFGTKVSEEEIIPENFQTLNTISKFVEQKMRGN
jgi:acyl carrier protein